MGICVCMADFLHCPPETTATLFTSYTPIENKNLKKMGQSIGEIIINIKNEKKKQTKTKNKDQGKNSLLPTQKISPQRKRRKKTIFTIE